LTDEDKRKRDWTPAKEAREANRSEKVQWLIDRGFNERTVPAVFYEQHKDKGCPYTRPGLYRVRDTMFRGKAISGKHNAGTITANQEEEQEEPAPPTFSMILNAGRWR
jgi:hypothetical protein